jgi:hypothetical protein
VIWGDVRDLSMLPNLLSLTIGMRSDDEADETEEFGQEALRGPTGVSKLAANVVRVDSQAFVPARRTLAT